jgi:restriction system protein
MSDALTIAVTEAVPKTKRRFTITDAIIAVMRQKERPLTPSEAYGAIIERNLYKFNTDDPVSVVRAQICRRCIDVDFASASSNKYFKSTNDGRYELIEQINSLQRPLEFISYPTLQQLIELHRQYDLEVRDRVLDSLKKLTPATFERFAERLLKAYGFERVTVTRRTRDGGIDGHGRLSLGLSTIAVAFQCKRYLNKPIGRETIDAFRGAISGLYEQGYFFTTSRFTVEAIEVQRRPGAVPIVLFDGENIVRIMFEKAFGVSFRDLKLAELALDEILEEG